MHRTISELSHFMQDIDFFWRQNVVFTQLNYVDYRRLPPSTS